MRADSSPSTVLVKVGGRAITRADFEQFKARLVQATAEDAQTDSALLRSLVDKTVLVMEATSLGIDREPGFRKKLLQFGGRQISKRYSSQEIQRKVSVSAEEFLQHFHATDRDRALRLAIILVPTRAQAAQVLEELEEGVPFAQLARERSEHETRDQGGDAGVYHLKDTAAEPIRDPVFKLAVGELSESLAFHGKWAVIKILDEIPVPLAQVEDIVRGEVLQRKVKERTRTVADSLFQAYAPELIEPNIAQLSQAFARDVADSSRFDDQVLCTFAGGRVTFGNLRALVPRADFSNADNVDSLVKDILPLRLFLEEGLRLGLDVHPAIEAAMKDERENLLVSRVRKQSVDDLIPEPTIEEARNFYAQHPEKFQTLETIVATEILVMFKDRAEELREQIDAGADPAELASLHSIRDGGGRAWRANQVDQVWRGPVPRPLGYREGVGDRGGGRPGQGEGGFHHTRGPRAAPLHDEAVQRVLGAACQGLHYPPPIGLEICRLHQRTAPEAWRRGLRGKAVGAGHATRHRASPSRLLTTRDRGVFAREKTDVGGPNREGLGVIVVDGPVECTSTTALPGGHEISNRHTPYIHFQI